MLIRQWLRLLRGRFIDPTNYIVANRPPPFAHLFLYFTRTPALSRFCTTAAAREAKKITVDRLPDVKSAPVDEPPRRKLAD